MLDKWGTVVFLELSPPVCLSTSHLAQYQPETLLWRFTCDNHKGSYLNWTAWKWRTKLGDSNILTAALMAKLKETRQRCGSYTDPQTSGAEPRAQKPASHMFMVRWLPEEPNSFDGERTDSSLLWTTSNLSSPSRSYISCIRAKPDSSQPSKILVFATHGQMVKMHRTRGHGGTSPNWYINSTTPVPKAWRTSWRKAHNDCKSQKARKIYCHSVSPRNDGELHPWYLNNKTAYSRPKNGHQ